MDPKTAGKLKAVRDSLGFSGFSISEEKLRDILEHHHKAKLPALMKELCRRVDAEVQRTGKNYYDVLRELSASILGQISK